MFHPAPCFKWCADRGVNRVVVSKEPGHSYINALNSAIQVRGFLHRKFLLRLLFSAISSGGVCVERLSNDVTLIGESPPAPTLSMGAHACRLTAGEHKMFPRSVTYPESPTLVGDTAFTHIQRIWARLLAVASTLMRSQLLTVSSSFRGNNQLTHLVSVDDMLISCARFGLGWTPISGAVILMHLYYILPIS